MKYLMQSITIVCISFTFSSIFYVLFSYLSIFPPYEEQMVFNMLFISIGITVLITLTHLLPIQHLFILRMIEIFIVLIILLAAGKFFEMFPFNPYFIFSVLTSGVLTYIVVITVIFIGDSRSANNINRAIRKRKEEGLNE